jgi:endonuclease/exonuclease/phosphatase (EEP) superfamily protein YafD
MIIKTLQWNIGGAQLDGDLLPEGNLNYIINIIKNSGADIIFLQETHTNDSVIQAKVIAEQLGFQYFINDVYDKSHLEEGQGLSQAIISRFPITNHRFALFPNPHFEIINSDGKQWTSHDKGITTGDVMVSDAVTIKVGTLHLVPFHRFKINPLDDKYSDLRNRIAQLASVDCDRYILQGDFNFNSKDLTSLLPSLFNVGMQEAELPAPTRPNGMLCDHALYKGVTLVKQEIISNTLTDHFPVYYEFDVQ